MKPCLRSMPGSSEPKSAGSGGVPKKFELRGDPKGSRRGCWTSPNSGVESI